MKQFKIMSRLTRAVRSIVHVVDRNIKFKKQRCLQDLHQTFFQSGQLKQIQTFNLKHSFTVLHNRLKNLFKISCSKTRQLLCKQFLKWKFQTTMLRYMSRSKKEIESSFDKQVLNSKSKAESRLKEKEKQILQVKNEIESLNTRTNEFNQKIKEGEILDSKYSAIVLNLEKEVDQLNKDKTQIDNDISDSIVNKEHLENCIKELEQNSKGLIEQNKEKDVQLSAYIREMNELLEVFEKKSSKFVITLS